MSVTELQDDELGGVSGGAGIGGKKLTDSMEAQMLYGQASGIAAHFTQANLFKAGGTPLPANGGTSSGSASVNPQTTTDALLNDVLGKMRDVSKG